MSRLTLSSVWTKLTSFLWETIFQTLHVRSLLPVARSQPFGAIFTQFIDPVIWVPVNAISCIIYLNASFARSPTQFGTHRQHYQATRHPERYYPFAVGNPSSRLSYIHLLGYNKLALVSRNWNQSRGQRLDVSWTTSKESLVGQRQWYFSSPTREIHTCRPIPNNNPAIFRARNDLLWVLAEFNLINDSIVSLKGSWTRSLN
jgi:hypothetical protein